MANLVYRELLPSTGIRHAAFARLVSHDTDHLIVGRGSGVDVYSVTAGRFTLLSTQELFGEVHSLTTVTLRGPSAESILVDMCGVGAMPRPAVDGGVITVDAVGVTFGYGVIQGVGTFVHAKHRFINTAGFASSPVALTDPKHTCVAMVLCQDQLAVVPLRQEDTDVTATVIGKATHTVSSDDVITNDPWTIACARADDVTLQHTLTPYVTPLKSITGSTTPDGIEGNIIAGCFLHGYYQPTLALLTEPHTSSVARLAVKNYTATVVVATLDVSTQKAGVVWRFDHLPTDSRHIIPVPEPTGGVIVVSTNAITYLNHHYSIVLACNSFAAVTVDGVKYRVIRNPPHTPLDVALDACHVAFITPYIALVTLKDGEEYVLRLSVTAGTISGMVLEPQNTFGIVPSCTAVLSHGASHTEDTITIFQGSRVCDGLLLEVVLSPSSVAAVGTSVVTTLFPTLDATEADVGGEVDEGAGGGDDDDDDLYGEQSPKRSKPNTVVDQPTTAVPVTTKLEPVSTTTTQQDDIDAWLYGGGDNATGTGTSGETGDVGKPSATGGGVTSTSGVKRLYDDCNATATCNVIDSIPCLGAVAHTVLGLSSRTEQDVREFPSAPAATELVLCSGVGKRGSLVIASRGLKPTVQAALPLSQCVASYAIPLLPPHHPGGHYLLFLVFASGTTRVFQVAPDGTCVENIVGLSSEEGAAGLSFAGYPSADFITDNITTGVGLLTFTDINKSVLLQAYPSGVRLFDPDRTLQDVVVHFDTDVGGLGAPDAMVRDMQCVGNVAVVLLSNGTLRSLTVDEGDYDVVIQDPLSVDGETAGDAVTFGDGSPISCFTLFQLDVSYHCPMLHSKLQSTVGSTSHMHCVVIRQGGSLQWFVLPSFTLVFETVILHGPDVALHTGSPLQAVLNEDPLMKGLVTPVTPSIVSQGSDSTPIATPTPTMASSSAVSIVFSSFTLPTFTFVLANNDVLVYQLRPWMDNGLSTGQRSDELRLNRVPLALTQRLRHADVEMMQQFKTLKPLRPLVTTSHGVVILGPSPTVLMDVRGVVKAIPFTSPTLNLFGSIATIPTACKPFPVPTFVEMNFATTVEADDDSGAASLCVFGCENSIAFGTLPPLDELTIYDSGGNGHCSPGLVATTVPLDAAARHAVYMSYSSTPTMQLYAVALCTDMEADIAEEAAREARITQEEGEEHDQISMRWGPREDWTSIDPCGDDAPPLLDVAYEVRLYVGGSWEHIASFPLDLNERVLSLAEVTLPDAKNRMQAFVAVGTTFHTARGEDASPLGRLLLLQFSYTEEGLPSLHLYYEKSFKGAVSGVAFLQAKQRYIVVSGNNKMIEVLAWKLERSGNYELIKVGFFEAYNYIVDIHVVKSYILFSDAYKSVHFLRLTEAGDRSVTLTPLGKDYQPLSVSCSQFVSDGKSLMMAATDRKGNVQVFQYEPSTQAVHDTTVSLELNRKADFHIGSLACNMVSAKLNLTTVGFVGSRFGLLFGTVDGGIGSFVPTDELTFKRLLALQKLMTYALPHDCGLNPKDYRLFRNPECRRLVRDKHVVDGNLVWLYATLDRRLQREFARAINTTVDRILASLRDIDLSVGMF